MSTAEVIILIAAIVVILAIAAYAISRSTGERRLERKRQQAGDLRAEEFEHRAAAEQAQAEAEQRAAEARAAQAAADARMARADEKAQAAAEVDPDSDVDVEGAPRVRRDDVADRDRMGNRESAESREMGRR